MSIFKKWISRLRSKGNTENQSSTFTNLKKSLISLYIVRNTDGICLYSHHFQLGLMSQIENQLIGMGFSAMSKMMQEIVDSDSHLSLIDLNEIKVLIEEKGDLLGVLIATDNKPILREKLSELLVQFEKIFQLQRRIDDLGKHVCLDDYALTADLVALIFKDVSPKILEIIPIIFKSIRNDKSGGYLGYNNPSSDNKVSNIIQIQRKK